MTFEELYHANKNKVFNLALQYVQNSEDAEEITQDVFITVNHSLHSFKEKSSASTWIYRIAINKSLDFLKAKKRKKRFGFMTSLFFESTQELKHDVAHFNHPGIQLEDKEQLSHLFNLINSLPDSQKTALILNKIEHQSQAEIAAIMELSPKGVESLIQRAKANLSKKLDGNEG